MRPFAVSTAAADSLCPPLLAREQVDGVERHRDGADEQVADGQRRDEVVGRLADRALEDERQDHDQVAADRHQACRPCQQAQHDRLHVLVG